MIAALGVVAALAAVAPASAPPTLDVPFLAQGPLLCGGAAAAMVERYWGRRGVYARDYADLVRPSEGGIRTTELADGLRARGFEVEVHRGRPEAARRAVAAGLPPILLLESGEDRYHYVVVVEWSEDEVRVHDPLEGPGRPLGPDRLAALHGTTHFWTLVARPVPLGASSPGSTATDVSEPSPPPPSTSRARSGPDPQVPPTLLEALASLRRGDTRTAESTALPLARQAPEPRTRELAWELVATARYRAGRPLEALEAWNRSRPPRLDLVVIEGADRHRWRTLARQLPVRAESPLTASDLVLAERRLEAVPGVASARVGYRPLPQGTMELDVRVAERPRSPSTLRLGAAGVAALATGEGSVGFGPLISGAERWTVGGRVWEAHTSARAALAAPLPSLPGIARLELTWERQRFGGSGDEPAEQERLVSSLGHRVWVGPDTRLGLRVGLERWVGSGRAGRVGLSLTRVLVDERLGARMELDGWTGPGPSFARARIRMEGRWPRGSRSWRLRATGAWADAGAPPPVWEGAGVGRLRRPLLRGLRLDRGGALGGPGFGPRLVQASLEHAVHWQVGPAGAAIAAFVDGARIWGGPDDADGWLGSWGVQIEGGLGEERVEASLATGAGAWIGSVRMRVPAGLN